MVKMWRKTVWWRTISLAVSLAMVATLAMALSINALGTGDFVVTRDSDMSLVGAYDTLAQAITAINTSTADSYTIEVKQNEDIFAQLTIATGRDVTIKSDTSGSTVYVITQKGDYRHFWIRGSLTLSNIVLEGLKKESGFVTNGGVYLQSGSFTMNTGAIIEKCYNNDLPHGGGGVYVQSGSFTMDGGEIRNNYAVINGGGVHADGSSIIIIKGEAKIHGNSVSMDIGEGGGIYTTTRTQLTINGGIISGNRAKSGGGAFCQGPITLLNGAINGNEAANAGGGVASIIMFTMSGGAIYNNKAVYGGGLFNSGTFNMSSNAEIRDNIADSGGGIAMQTQDGIPPSKFAMSGGTISNNVAQGADSGGGLYILSGEAIISDGIITKNTADGNGGGIYVDDDGVFLMDGGTITENTAAGDGGGIYSTLHGNYPATPSSLTTYTNIGISDGTVSGNKAGTSYVYPGNWQEFSNRLQRRFNGQLLDNDNINYHCKTVSSYTVTYNPGDGSGTNVVIDVVYDQKYIIAPNPSFTCTGYTFTGWNTAKDGKGTAYTVGEEIPISGSLILYAQWTPNEYKVVFNANTGTGAMADQTFKYDEQKALSTNVFTKTNYKFIGWSTTPDSGVVYADEASVKNLLAIAGVYNLYAQWSYTGGSPGGTTTVIPPEEPPLDPTPFIDDHVAYIIGYPEGDVRPNNNITRAEVVTVFFRLLTDEVRSANWKQVNAFSDVFTSNWFNNAVSVMSNMKIVNGYPDGTFDPNGAITRAELATIAARFAKMMNKTEGGNTNSFSDISGHWAAEDIILAAKIGWVKGYEDGTYRPKQLITRAEFMTLVNRMMQREPQMPDDLLVDEMVTWVDNANPDAWYYLAVQEATNSHQPEFKEEFVTGLEFQYEKWEEMHDNPDWALLEKQWADGYIESQE